jgi:hypothetical protein
MVTILVLKSDPIPDHHVKFNIIVKRLFRALPNLENIFITTLSEQLMEFAVQTR